MTFTSDDMIKAANRYLKDLKVPVNFEERKQLKDGFFAGALWAASKIKEARQCKMKYFGNVRMCGNCGHWVGQSFKYCDDCGYKFIKGE